jgi:multidrug efflux pump subunit AcrA (membrane-fusion protein)
MKRAIVILVVLAVVSGVVFGWWYLDRHPQWRSWLAEEFGQAVEELGLTASVDTEALIVSGFIEADEAAVMTELGGRIRALHADEGDEVQAGDILVRLDDVLLASQRRVAEADLAVAEAQLALVRAGLREESLEYAEAVLEQAVAAQAAALTAWEDAQAMAEHPQERELALIGVRAQLGVINLQEEQARALANAAQAGRDFADDAFRLLDGLEIVPISLLDEARYEQTAATYQSWLAWTKLEQAQVARSGVEETLDLMEQQLANPVNLQAQANAARAQYEIASAGVEVARAQLAGMKLGATAEQVSAAEAQVAIASAALEALAVQAAQLELEAPISGLVLERPVHIGELALPGARLLTLADLENVTLTVYVPEDQLGVLQIGLPVSVTVDAYPQRVFRGSLSNIASHAEFTPKNVQTRDERVSMVFAVKIKLPNADYALKPGMPADALLPERQ